MRVLPKVGRLSEVHTHRITSGSNPIGGTPGTHTPVALPDSLSERRLVLLEVLRHIRDWTEWVPEGQVRGGDSFT